MNEVIASLVGGFPFQVVQDCATLLKVLRDANINPNFFIDFVDETVQKNAWSLVEYQKREYDLRNRYRASVPRCEACGNQMTLSEVNHAPGAMIGGNYKCVWSCVDMMKCGHQVFSDRPLMDEAKKYNLEIFFSKRASEAEERMRLARRRKKLARRQRV